VWQQFVARNADKAFQFVSVAVDTQGAEAARPWTERAGATFPTVVDRDNALAAIYDYNGTLLTWVRARRTGRGRARAGGAQAGTTTRAVGAVATSCASSAGA